MACWVMVVVGVGLSLSVPGMWVVWVTWTSAATQSRVQISAALVAMDRLGLSVIAQVSAVTLPPEGPY